MASKREQVLSTLKPGQKAKIPGWMNFSELVQALVEAIPYILEYEGNTPGEKLSRALDRASIADEAMAMLADVVDIMGESQGIDGWHLNGDIAVWDEILPGFEDAYAALVEKGAPRER